MPNIREVNAGTDIGLRPDDRAAQSTANAGRRMASLYNTAAEAEADTGRRIASAVVDVGNVVQKWAENREVSKQAADSAITLASLDKEWNETVKNADPNDPTLAAKFREEVVEPRLQALRDGPITEGGQRYAEAATQRFRNHFFEKTASDMARLAGVAARQNIETLTNQFSNAAITDPTSLKTSLGMVEHSVSAMVDSSPNLGGVDAARLKMELTLDSQKAIVKAAAIGAINVNPEEGFKKFSGPEYSKYISGAELKQLEQQANSVQRAQRVDETYRKTLETQAKKEASDKREDEYIAAIHSGDPREMGKVSAKTIATDPTLTREARQRMIGIVERETKPEAAAKVSNRTASDLISRVRAPQGDPRRIDSLDPVYEAFEKGELNKADLKFVREEFVNMRTPEGARLGDQQEEFIKSVKPLIDKSNPMLGKLDASGPQQVYNFTMALRKKVDEYRKAGKDPQDLMDPSKPDYMGSPGALVPYQKTLAQSMEDTVRSMRPGPAIPPPIKVNTPADAAKLDAGTRYQTPDGKVYVR
jgi:hypothetical protein